MTSNSIHETQRSVGVDQNAAQVNQSPLPLGISESLHGGGMDIFWNVILVTQFPL